MSPLDPWTPSIFGETILICIFPFRVSTFFGNTVYLVAMTYYTIISFLGYNGMLYPFRSPSPRQVCSWVIADGTSLTSPPIPPPYRIPPFSDDRFRHFLVRQPVWLQHPLAFWASSSPRSPGMIGMAIFLSSQHKSAVLPGKNLLRLVVS